MAKRVVLGCELNNSFLQIVYAPEGGRPAALNMPSSKETLVLPLVIARSDAGTWCYGDEALKLTGEKGRAAERLYENRGGSIRIDKDVYTYDELLNLVISHGVRLALQSIEQALGEDADIRVMAVSCEPFPSDVKTFHDRCFKGLPVGQVVLQGHEESLFSYLIHQPEKLLGYVTGVYDLTCEKMTAYCMELNPRTSPVVVSISRDDDTGIVVKKHYPSIVEHDRALDEMDKKLAEYTGEFTGGRIVTSLYLLGDSFKKDWYKSAKQVMCRNRKVYAGNNLFSKGAAFSAAAVIWPGTEKEDFLYLGRDMLSSNIGLQVIDQGQEAYMPLLDAGTAWYDAQAETEIIMEVPDEIVLLVQPVDGSGSYEEHIRIGIEEERSGRAFRFNMKLRMTGPDLLEVTVKDEGFGSIYPAGYPDIVEEIKLGQDKDR